MFLKLSRSFREQCGFTLVEVSIATALLIFVSFGLLEIKVNYARALRQTRFVFARTEIATRIRMNARQISAYLNSQIHQPALKPCLEFTNAGPLCASKNGNNVYIQTPLVLMSQNDANELVAGPATEVGDLAPVYYDNEGKLCPTAVASPGDCPLQAIASYSAYCSNGRAACYGAEALQLNYHVKLRDDFPGKNEVIMKPASGVVVTDVGGAEDFRILNASTIGIPSFTDIEMIKGEALAMEAAAPVNLSIRLHYSEPVDSIEIRFYAYANGCTFSTLNQTACTRPALENYTLLQTLPVTPGSQNGLYAASVVTPSVGYGEIIALAKLNGGTIIRSSTVLRIRKPSIATASISGPLATATDCTTSGLDFTFQAQDDRGLKEARAWITPALPAHPDGSLPGFSFNLASSSAQPYTLPIAEMEPGTDYSMYFSVTNFDGVSADANVTFEIPEEKAETITFDTPQAGAFLRPSDPLGVETTIHLQCGKNLTSSQLSVFAGSTMRMSPASLTCSPATSSKPRMVAFRCSGTFSCWLDQANCLNPQVSDNTLITLNSVANPNTGLPLSAAQEIVVGSKVTASFVPRDTVSIIERGFLKVSTVPFKIRFSASLPFPAALNLAYSSGESVNVTCPAGSSVCTASGPVPAVSATVRLNRQATADPSLVIGMPSAAYVNYFDGISDCDNQVYKVTCPAGSTRKIQIIEAAANDFNFADADDQDADIEVFPFGNLDFFFTARLRDSSDGTGRVGLVLSQKHYDDSNTEIATTISVPVEVDIIRETRQLKFSDELWKSVYNPNYFKTKVRVNLTKSSGEVDAYLIRQCYCD